MLPTLDYDDMVKTGQAVPNEGHIKDGLRKYAVLIKNAYTSIGKFDITDAESVRESITALKDNADIPDVIRKSAEYYVKAAADYYGIPWDVVPDSSPHEIVISDIVVKSAEHEDVPMLTFGDRKFILSDEEHIKEAEEYFLLKKYLYPASQRINISRLIVKAAAFSGHTPDPVVRAYCRAEYGNNVEETLMKKASLTSYPKYAQVMSALCKSYSSIPVAEFIDMIDTCDKVADVRHSRYGIETHDVLIDTPRSAVDDLLKVARNNDLLVEISSNE